MVVLEEIKKYFMVIYFRNTEIHYFPKHRNLPNHKMSDSLPIFQAIKVTPKSFIVGHPKQLVELLASGVATAIVKSKSKDSGAFYECLLRCQLLAPNVNLPVYFCIDNQNHPLSVAGDTVTMAITSEGNTLPGVNDVERGLEWNENMELALSYWAVKMEEAVLSLYPDRKPKQVDSYATRGVLEMKVSKFVKDFNIEEFLANTARRSGFPVFKIAYGWIGSKEDQRSKDHIWGIKFDFSNYAQFPILPRTRKPAASAAERQEMLLKKRKSDDSVPTEVKTDETA